MKRLTLAQLEVSPCRRASRAQLLEHELTLLVVLPEARQLAVGQSLLLEEIEDPLLLAVVRDVVGLEPVHGRARRREPEQDWSLLDLFREGPQEPEHDPDLIVLLVEDLEGSAAQLNLLPPPRLTQHLALEGVVDAAQLQTAQEVLECPRET